ncbi:ABC-type probable sulfate transporter, periplasmic binding protein [Planococcus halocryophilus Or1]|uniref:ABC transporter substrate-binding protein n=1 Tax=Planococcus halocryophilus TaxID=1215089 RepID=A0A1C7DUP3_9BACL|nr:ABC transporter substrate-binding protein [Planococcus halocryophilus]ANU15360.1 ABC transporter substrate-binding protein [Planococcus halocryophilus]EMF47726.1 ABC-type probable sulfate transporter, periplasmic binding protein [Planococcus halocryophilus Or1]
MKRFISLIVLLTLAGTLAACGSPDASEDSSSVTIGYFPNLDHVPAMIAKDQKLYEKNLADGTTVDYVTFADGADFMTALKTGDIDAGLVGPGPAMNNYTNGADVTMIAGGASGGTVVMARNGSGIDSVDDFAGKTFITPRVGCTHDVQFETFMKEQGITSNRIGGEMLHQTGNPAQYEALFATEKVDVAVAPEPWASVLKQNTGAKVIIEPDEISFGTTLPASVLVTSSKLIKENPEMVEGIVNAHKEATEFITENPDQAKEITIDTIDDITGQKLEASIIDGAWENMIFDTALSSEEIQAFGDSSFDLKFLKEQPDFALLTDTQFLE